MGMILMMGSAQNSYLQADSVGERQQLSILVVDDQIRLASYLRESLLASELLQKLAPEIDIASSLNEVSELMAQKHYHVGISDLHCIAEEDGIEIVRSFKDQGAIAVALITASERSEDVFSRLKRDVFPSSNGAPHFRTLIKPLYSSRFLELETWLARITTPLFELPKEEVSLLKQMWAPPYIPVTLLSAVLFVVSFASFILWIVAHVAIIHPVFSLTGTIGGIGLLTEIALAIRSKGHSV